MWPFSRKPKKKASDVLMPLEDRALQEQYAKVRTMARRELHWALRSRQALLVGFGGALLCVAGLTYGLDALAPSVRLIPMFVYTRADGTIRAEPLTSMIPDPTVHDAVLRAGLWQYLQWREGYTFDTRITRYNIVTEMSNRDVGDAYAAWYNAPNPDSPQVKYGKTGMVLIDMDSAEFLSADPSVYQINYYRKVVVPGQPTTVSHWTAYVHYHLVDSIPLNDRYQFNPAAIKVTSYPPPTQIGAPPTTPAKAPNP